MSKPLLPPALAIWTAFEMAECNPYLVDPRKASLAAAMRELEDTLAQDRAEPMPPDLERAVLAERIRLFRRITTIAAELEAM
jgi:hypothetical protein